MVFANLTLDLDVTYVGVLVLFLLPLLILNALVFRPFLQLFADRHERLEGALVRAEERVNEAERKAQTFDSKIKVATTKGMEARNQIRAKAESAMALRLDGEKKQLQAKVEAALKEIHAARDQALSEVGREATALAELTARKLIGTAVHT